MSAINFKTKLYKIGDRIILRLPETASQQLPSRGQTMVEGTINGHPFKTPLEPDGRWSHWFDVNSTLLTKAGAKVGVSVSVTLTPIKTWSEPPIPDDVRKALAATPSAYELWQQVTPLARWEWVRWIRSTGQAETRKRRIDVACSKLEAGKRRPCCWNRNLCTEPTVSKNGVLLEPVGS